MSARHQRVLLEGYRAAVSEPALLERIETAMSRWVAGEDGERRTAVVLGRLPKGWHYLHDRIQPGAARANIDHVVIGPTGVSVIDTKNWSGRLTLSMESASCGGSSMQPDIDALRRVCRRIDVGLRRDVPAGTRAVEVPVRGLIALAQDNCGTERSIDGVVVAPLSRLIDVVTAAGEPLLDRSGVKRIVSDFERLCPAPTPIDGGDPAVLEDLLDRLLADERVPAQRVGFGYGLPWSKWPLRAGASGGRVALPAC